MPEKVPNAVPTLLHQPDNWAVGVVMVFGNEVCNMTSRYQILSDQHTDLQQLPFETSSRTSLTNCESEQPLDLTAFTQKCRLEGDPSEEESAIWFSF